ncbi:uncharacterized protein LAESUDRAFT_641846 [Laetiporus sulphureus 93-53]|uniref:Uncharacterized protein n=1 Tax=Laetiporus sulphureus 93-53 TaxID=1314785 RepID=A0A165HVR5_9APHY|nr:uncharacterized protein LAESUDRAFT_641846 [Laetiporus sulphureus 93-53]KZT12255.1 hypothetical protein LAESUDRAFT_641846 [Laetiporus sulphureus 93-53]
MRDEFDRDPEEFCRAVRAGEIAIDEEDFPSFMYPEQDYDELDPVKNLMCAPILFTLAKVLYFGPASAESATPSNAKPRGGRPPLNKQYKLDHCTPQMLAYLCLLVRFAFCACSTWDEGTDNAFFGPAFYNNCLELLNNPKIGGPILEIWNRYVIRTSGHTY